MKRKIFAILSFSGPLLVSSYALGDNPKTETKQQYNWNELGKNLDRAIKLVVDNHYDPNNSSANGIGVPPPPPPPPPPATENNVSFLDLIKGGQYQLKKVDLEKEKLEKEQAAKGPGESSDQLSNAELMAKLKAIRQGVQDDDDDDDDDDDVKNGWK